MKVKQQWQEIAQREDVPVVLSFGAFSPSSTHLGRGLQRNVAMRSIVAWFCCGLLLMIPGCGFNEIRDRRATLEKLLTTNAPLSVVESAIGNIPIYKPGSSGWNDLRSHYARHPNRWYQQLAQKIDKSAAFGWKSTMTMQTWIFLDDKGRLTDFDVGAQ